MLILIMSDVAKVFLKIYCSNLNNKIPLILELKDLVFAKYKYTALKVYKINICIKSNKILCLIR